LSWAARAAATCGGAAGWRRAVRCVGPPPGQRAVPRRRRRAHDADCGDARTGAAGGAVRPAREPRSRPAHGRWPTPPRRRGRARTPDDTARGGGRVGRRCGVRRRMCGRRCRRSRRGARRAGSTSPPRRLPKYTSASSACISHSGPPNQRLTSSRWLLSLRIVLSAIPADARAITNPASTSTSKSATSSSVSGAFRARRSCTAASANYAPTTSPSMKKHHQERDCLTWARRPSWWTSWWGARPYATHDAQVQHAAHVRQDRQS
jgi:hypothetical protein